MAQNLISQALSVHSSSMCGRYYIAPEDGVEELENIRRYIDSRYGEQESKKLAQGEIFPSNYVPVVLTHADGFIARPMTWGFPGFKGSQLLINARSETVIEKVTFRDAVRKTRCLIPMTGFYEWSHDERGKALDKYLFTDPEHHMLYLGGIYKEFDDGPRFVILTTASNPSIADIHHRMPLAIGQEQLRDYIDSDEAALSMILGDGEEKGPKWSRIKV